MKYTRILFGAAITIFSCIGISAQTTTSASGGEAKGRDGLSSYTVGQMVYLSSDNQQLSLNEGIQQPYTFSVIAGKSVNDIDVFIVAYPNPASTTLTLQIKGQKATQYRCQLLDIAGRVVYSQLIESELTSIPIEEKANGSYILQVSKESVIVKSFQIVKKK